MDAMTTTELLESIKYVPDFDPSEIFEECRFSYFDHFLSAEEADACQYLFHKLAVENGVENEFIAVENKFLRLWASLACAGNNFGIGDTFFEIASLAELFRIGSSVIREERGFPIFFSGSQVIWEPACDLTHVLWIPKGSDWTPVHQLVRLCGLYILE
jgi:hypothetical protein